MNGSQGKPGEAKGRQAGAGRKREVEGSGEQLEAARHESPQHVN